MVSIRGPIVFSYVIGKHVRCRDVDSCDIIKINHLGNVFNFNGRSGYFGLIGIETKKTFRGESGIGGLYRKHGDKTEYKEFKCVFHSVFSLVA